MTSQTARGQVPARARNRRRVLRAAHALIDRHGLEALTMRQLAFEADVSVASLYNLIGGRDEIVRALGLYILEELDEAVVQLDKQDPLDRAHDLIGAVTDTVTKELPRSVLLALLSDVDLYTTLSPSWQPSQTLAGEMRSMVAAGTVNDDLPVTLIAKQVWWSQMGYLRQWATGRLDGRQLRAAALYSLDLCLLAISTPTGRPRLLEHARSLEGALGDL
jgi:AcrR family transcriptional regulator